jgi:hypothetical protein
MTPQEVDMIATLAASAGLSGSDIVRQLVRQAYAAKYGEKKPKPRTVVTKGGGL